MSNSEQRFVALDVHKRYVMIAAVNARQEVVLTPRRLELSQLDGWVQKHLEPTDHAVLEATTNAWYVHDLLEPHLARVVVAHPYHVKLIAAAAVKTDKRDTLTLARLLAANIIPEIWVPPQPVRELRALIAHRQRLIAQRSAAKNRLQSVLHRHHILPPAGRAFSNQNKGWWLSLSLDPSEKLRAQQDLSIIAHLSPLIEAVEAELARLSVSQPWTDQTPFLIQLPGVGLLTAMTILSAIGDVSRFPSAKKLVGYAGLGARVHVSGQTHRGGGITKQGRKELRAAMVEAAWSAVRSHPFWKRQFAQLERRMHPKPIGPLRGKAIVAVARKLLVAVWYVLTHRAADRYADPEQVAFKLMTWSWKLNDQLRRGLTTRQPVLADRPGFIRYHLIRLGIGHDLQAIGAGAPGD
ncbi:MAG: IS110 family transposase, partial [Anaerolineales bacterium]